MNMIFGKQTVDKVFEEAVKTIHEILTAFAGDILYGKTVDKDNQQPASAPQGTEAQRHQFIGWFASIFMGLSAEDEAAFLEALTSLKPAHWVKIGARLKALGDPNKADTPEARAFRKAVVTMTDFKARVKVLQMAAELPQAEWLILADASGAAVAGQLDQAWRLVRDHFGPKILAGAKATDQKIAQAIQGWEPNFSHYTFMMHEWRIGKKEALQRHKKAPRSARRWLGEFFGILRPLPLNPGTRRGFLHRIGEILGLASSYSSSGVRSAGTPSVGNPSVETPSAETLILASMAAPAIPTGATPFDVSAVGRVWSQDQQDQEDEWNSEQE